MAHTWIPTEQERSEILGMAAAGKSLWQMAARFGVSKHAARAVMMGSSKPSPIVISEKVCPDCRKNLPIGEFLTGRYTMTRCSLCRTKKTREGGKVGRLAAIQKLGGKCVKCGFADERALQFDHVNAADRKSQLHGSQLYRAIVRGGKHGVQLLCANCHSIKTKVNGEYGKGRPGTKKSTLRTKHQADVEPLAFGQRRAVGLGVERGQS